MSASAVNSSGKTRAMTSPLTDRLTLLRSLRERWYAKEPNVGTEITHALGTEGDSYSVLFAMVDEIERLKSCPAPMVANALKALYAVPERRAFSRVARQAASVITALQNLYHAANSRAESAAAELSALKQQNTAQAARIGELEELGVASLASERPQPEGGVAVKPSEGSE